MRLERRLGELVRAGTLSSLPGHRPGEVDGRLRQAAAALVSRGAAAGDPAAGFFVPGRIEIVGKHTDYAGGRSLVAATRQGLVAVAVPRSDDRLVMVDLVRGSTARIGIGQRENAPPGSWTAYPGAVARRLAANFPDPLRGAEVAFSSDLPAASGLSSSSALVVVAYLVLARMNDLAERPGFRAEIEGDEGLATYLSCIENGEDYGRLRGDRGVGTRGGSEDHLAIVCSRSGRVGQYRFRPTRLERSLEMPEDWVFVIAASGVRARKTGAAGERFNRLSRLAERAAELWRWAEGDQCRHLGDLLESGPQAAERFRRLLSSPEEDEFSRRELLDRVEQFLVESGELVPAAGDALERKDREALGRVAERSQKLAETRLGNQVPETVFLARSASELGAFAASAFGAGWGGAVWALVERPAAEQMRRAWASAYRERYPRSAARAAFFCSGAGPPAGEI